MHSASGSYIVMKKCSTWEEAETELLAIGVPQEELPNWHPLWSLQEWNKQKEALAQEQDPREAISTSLDEFGVLVENGAFQCHLLDSNGEFCYQESKDKDEAISHVCAHLDSERCVSF